MYASFKRIEPGMDERVELGEEWGIVERQGGEEISRILTPRSYLENAQTLQKAANGLPARSG